MSRLVLTQITIKKERSISSTTWYYLLQPSNASAPDPTNYGNPPPTYTDTGYSGWSTTEPTYTVGDDRVLYIMVQTLYSDNTFSYATPTISSSYEAAKDAYNEALQAEADIEDLQELGLHHGYIWYNSTARPATGNIPVYPVGSYIASGINNTINQTNSNTYGLNTWISTGGINLRYNAIDLAKLTTSTLEFYYPSTSSRGTAAISLGTHSGVNSLIFYGFGSTDKQMELTATALNFYGSSQSNADVTLNSNGLNITKGSIILGGGSFVVTNNGAITATSGTIGGWHLGDNFLSTETNGIPHSGVITLSQGIILPSPSSPGSDESISDNGVLPYDTELAFTVSNQFGITKSGTLYATGAQINGELGGTTIDDIHENINTLGDTITNQAISINKIQAICTEEIFYVPTQDIEIVANKNYYTRSGAGTEQDPYIYTQVVTPVIADIGTYYEESPKITGIILSKGDYQLSITSDSLIFQNQGINSAYLSNQALNIPSVEITNDLTLGPFKWVVSTNRLTLMRG